MKFPALEKVFTPSSASSFANQARRTFHPVHVVSHCGSITYCSIRRKRALLDSREGRHSAAHECEDSSQAIHGAEAQAASPATFEKRFGHKQLRVL